MKRFKVVISSSGIPTTFAKIIERNQPCYLLMVEYWGDY